MVQVAVEHQGKDIQPVILESQTGKETREEEQVLITDQVGRHLSREHRIIQKEVAKAVMKVVLCILAGVPGLVVAATVVELGETHLVNQPKEATALSSSATGHTKNNNLNCNDMKNNCLIVLNGGG